MNLQVFGRNVTGLQGAVSRLQADHVALAIVPLERGLFLSLEPSNNRGAIVNNRALLDQNDVAVVDEILDHRCALHPECIDVCLAR